MRVSGCVFCVEADKLHQIHDLVVPLFFVGVQMMDIERLSDDVFHRHSGIQRGVRILEHHLHFLAKSVDILVCYKLSVKIKLAAGRLVKAKECTADRCLAAAGLSHQSQRLAGLDVEGHAVNRFERYGCKQACFDRKIFF